MNFSYYDLGQLEKGKIIEVTLSAAANVQLMTLSNFSNYKNGRRYNYYGGYVTRSPYTISVPSSGHWYLVIDLGGYSGTVRHSLRVLQGRLPAARRQIPLIEEPNLYIDNNDINKTFDIFISHASEDKESVVRPLANALANRGLKVWFDEFELRIGDSLRRKIDQGLANSKFGIVVISRNFIRKGWTNYELDGLITKAITNQQIILPIWHEITKQEVLDYSPSLADKVARSTAQDTIEEIADEISALVLGDR